MSDIVVLPHQMKLSSELLIDTAGTVRSAADRLDHAQAATPLNRADPGLSVDGLIGRSRRTTAHFIQTSDNLRDLGGHVQLTLTRILAADDGGAAASADPTPGHLLHPGVGFGNSSASDFGVMWLNLYTFESMVENAPRVPATAAAIASNGGRLRPTYQALRRAEETPGMAAIAARHAHRPAAAVRRAAQASLWADEATFIGARVSTGVAGVRSVASASTVLPIARAAGSNAIGTAGIVLDVKSAAEAYHEGDAEMGTVHAVRALGGAVALAPGGQVVGLSLIGATYVYEYREELWGSVLSIVDVAEGVFE